MIVKTLADMSWTELHAALTRAKIAKQAAEYQENSRDYEAQLAAAIQDIAAVNAEIDKRIAAMQAAGGDGNGGG